MRGSGPFPVKRGIELDAMCELKILSEVTTGFTLHKQRPSYENFACSNSLLVIVAVSECFTEPLKITLFQ
jgi:hypothetical protein